MIVFDEAHNIEDVSREAASLDLTRGALAETHGALAKAATFNGRPEVYGPLREAAARLIKWLDEREQRALEVRRPPLDPGGAPPPPASWPPI